MGQGTFFVALGAFVVGACGASATDSVGTSGDEMSTTVHSVYGMTTFGGKSDPERSMACTLKSSLASQPYYVASSQRYGCFVHLEIRANGKCVVAQTEDAGPATYVESHAGEPVLDSSPAVAELLFGTTSLGFTDLRAHRGKYDVTVKPTDAPLGPCAE